MTETVGLAAMLEGFFQIGWIEWLRLEGGITMTSKESGQMSRLCGSTRQSILSQIRRLYRVAWWRVRFRGAGQGQWRGMCDIAAGCGRQARSRGIARALAPSRLAPFIAPSSVSCAL